MRLYLLQENQDDYGAVALIEREVEYAMADKQLEEVTAALAAVVTRKAAL